VIVASVDGAGAEEAKRIIEQLTLKVQPGQIYMGKVVRIIPVGAFVELVPGKDGMVHVSQIAFHRVGKPEDALNVGDQVLVKVVEIDDRGRVNLTIKGVSDEERAAHGLEPLPRPTPEEMEAQRAQFANAGGGGERRGPRPGGGGFGGGGRGPRPGGDRY
jgi:polyribonucleotide nucleotidyltransferase